MNPTDRFPPVEPDLDDDMDPVDPDIALITDYLCRELPSEQARAVEARLTSDMAFYMKVGPLIKLWRMPVDWRARLSARAAERAAEAAAAAPSAVEAAGPKLVREPAIEYRLDEPLNEVRILGFTLPQADPLRATEPDDGKEPIDVKVVHSLVTGGWNMYKLAIAVWIVALIPFSLYLRYGMTPHDPVATIIAPTAQATTPATVLPGSTLIEAKRGESKEITLNGGSQVAVRDGSRFWYAYTLTARTVIATLRGEIALHVADKDRSILIHTSAGSVLATPGDYAVRCADGCSSFLVTVGAAGVAYLRNDTTKASVTLLKGDLGRLKKGGAPEKVANGEGWPELSAPIKP
jgi:hypothetical protein